MELHSSSLTGHSGFWNTYARPWFYFFCPGMKKDIGTFVSKFDTFQWNKGELVKPLGTLQPLPILSSIWNGIYMDFIIGLLKAINKSIIMVVVDCLSKYAHFYALPHPFTSTLVENIFLDHIFKIHGMPTSIISNRDRAFTSKFWLDFFKCQWPQLNIITSYHPQINKQT